MAVGCLGDGAAGPGWEVGENARYRTGAGVGWDEERERVQRTAARHVYGDWTLLPGAGPAMVFVTFSVPDGRVITSGSTSDGRW